ncbi:unnamed protein product [Ixodes hexagonus]
MSQQLLQSPFNLPKCDLSDSTTHYTEWYSCDSYLTMVAACDMFLKRFPDSHVSRIRMGTMPSHFKDCNALVSLGGLVKPVGIPLPELLQWIFVPEVALDIARLNKPGQELCEEHSYTPYLTDFHLVSKSPYSSSANKALHLWCHTLGVFMPVERSMNARHIDDVHTTDIISNTMLVAYARRSTAVSRPMFLTSKTKADEEGQAWAAGVDQGGAEIAEGAPTTLEPQKWYQYLARNQFRLDPTIMSFFTNLVQGMPEFREGSVGKKLKLYLAAR